MPRFKLILVLCMAVLPALAACHLAPRQQPLLPLTTVNAVQARVPDSTATATAKALLRTKQFPAALRELQMAAGRGDGQSAYLLGLVYANGLGTPVSDVEARRWLTVAAEKSNADAAYALAGLLAAGSADDRAAAQRWMERAALGGQPLAMKLVSTHSLPFSQARDPAGDMRLARELLFWAIRRDPQAVAPFLQVAGVGAEDEFGHSALACAVATGSAATVRQLLAAGVPADHADHFGMTPLMAAAEGGNDAILAALLAATRDIDARDSVGNSAVVYATRAGRAKHVERLLAAGATRPEVSAKVASVRVERGVDPTHPGGLYDGWPALAIAASRDDANLVERLLADGAPPDDPTPQGDTALIVAAQYHAAKVIAPLLRAGAAPTHADNEGTTALGYAAAHGVSEVLDVLLRNGASPDTRGPEEEPPLVRAVRVRDGATMKRLIEAGADINASADGGQTALMIAATAADVELFDGLMAAHPDLARKDGFGRDALWFAASGGNEPIIDLLLAAGAPLEASGRSPLFAAIRAGRADTLERLLRKGLSPEATDPVGNTPLIAAASRGDPRILHLLLDGGASVDVQNAVGNTALIIATRDGNTAVCRMLLQAGADAALHNRDKIDALDTARRRHLGEITALLESR